MSCIPRLIHHNYCLIPDLLYSAYLSSHLLYLYSHFHILHNNYTSYISIQLNTW